MIMSEELNDTLLGKGVIHMATFAVTTSDEIITRGKTLLERMARPGEKQGDVLDRMFRIIEEQEDGEAMKQGGIDVQALDASLANIRNMFLASVAGKEQIILEKDSKIAEVKKLKEQLEADLREKLASAITEKDAAVAQAEAAAKAAAQAIKDAQAAKEQAETANSLAAEKDRTISTLADKLSDAEFKLDGYGALLEKNSVSEEQIKELHRTISDLKKDHAVEIRELTAKLEKQLTDAEKDTALSVAKAVADKERELTALLREAEKEIARLQARIEVMEAHN